MAIPGLDMSSAVEWREGERAIRCRIALWNIWRGSLGETARADAGGALDSADRATHLS